MPSFPVSFINHAYRLRWLSGSSSRGIKRSARSIDKFVYGRKSSTHIEPSMRTRGNGTSAVSTLVDMFASLEAILQLCSVRFVRQQPIRRKTPRRKAVAQQQKTSPQPPNDSHLKTTSPARALPGLPVAPGRPLTQTLRGSLAFASWPPGWATARATTNAPRRALTPRACGCARARR